MIIGDKVRYSTHWLKSCGIHYGDICFAVGVIMEFTNLGQTKLAQIEWDSTDLPRSVNVVNLEIVL